MSGTSKKQLLLILAGVVVLGGLYFLPSQASSEEVPVAQEEQVEESHEGHDHEPGEGHGHEHAEDEYAGRLDSADFAFIDEIEKEIALSSNTMMHAEKYDTLIALGIKRNVPPIVAKYTEQKAMIMPSVESYMLAGDNFFKAFRLSKTKPKELAIGAIRNYERVLAIDSTSLQAQTAIGVVNVEGSAQLGVMPMVGIGILKEVLNKDPENVDAMTNLGYFAIQSGQFEKAVERFERVLELDPQNAEAYLYLTDALLSQEKVEEGIKTLEKYKSIITDPLMQQQVEKYIQDLRNKK